ncbi:MAG: dockerin type I repeat-containing protein, partial [candidate division Zixibacteria bacterium]|nr:dockerin type I repeat-containing protein [candidate division Zixibacteria bacterium]
IGISVHQLGTTSILVEVIIIDPSAMTDFDYRVTAARDSSLGAVWHLFNTSTGDTVLYNQTTFNGDNTIVTDGFLVIVSNSNGPFLSFEVVANGAGPVVPPSGGALDFQGFPSLRPDDAQQVGAGHWAFHTGDNGGSCDGGNRGSYEAFLLRVLRNDNPQDLGLYDYEMRFTGNTNSSGDYDSSLGGGSIAIRAFQDDFVTWVPFELWNIGIGTPNDASDDVRMVVWHLDFGDDSTYNLEAWGCSLDSFFGPGGGEHSASGGDNDPFTDWIYWLYPIDSTPGDVGYQTRVSEMLAGTYDYGDEETIARTVLINWNGGVAPPFNQKLPEPGTVFRLRTPNEIPIDTFDFRATPPPTIEIGPEAVSIYSKYILINKSSNTYNNFFISLWFDPDLGNAGDDLIGCDTLDNIFFCYNEGADSDYGSAPPAFGGKLISGPPMYSFMKYRNGTDPLSYQWTYQYMNGLDASQGGIPLANGTRYAVPGDPVSGIGDIDFNSSDRRMMATFGPLTFTPGDTQEIVFKLAVGDGDSPLSSITELKEILNSVPPEEPELISYLKPDPQRIVFKFSIEPIMDTVFLGWSTALNVDGINGSSIMINDSIAPISTALLSSHPGHSGPVWQIVFPAKEFLETYGLLWGTTMQDYSVSGIFTDSLSFVVNSSIEVIGHRGGDINRNGRLDIADLVFLVDYIFRGGPSPEPIEAGDANYDGSVTVLDILVLVDHIFRGGS